MMRPKTNFLNVHDNQFVNLDRRIEEITEDLQNFFRKQLRSISESNAATVYDYIIALNKEINLSRSYRKDIININILCTFSKFVDNKAFQDCHKNDLESFLDNLSKSLPFHVLHQLWIQLEFSKV